MIIFLLVVVILAIVWPGFIRGTIKVVFWSVIVLYAIVRMDPAEARDCASYAAQGRAIMSARFNGTSRVVLERRARHGSKTDRYLLLRAYAVPAPENLLTANRQLNRFEWSLRRECTNGRPIPSNPYLEGK